MSEPIYKTDFLDLYHADCMDIMKTFPDKYFDLAIVDPPYGIGISGQKECKKGKKSDRKLHKQKNWDNAIPSKEYFNELFRISKNQIIWGAKEVLYKIHEIGDVDFKKHLLVNNFTASNSGNLTAEILKSGYEKKYNVYFEKLPPMMISWASD